MKRYTLVITLTLFAVCLLAISSAQARKANDNIKDAQVAIGNDEITAGVKASAGEGAEAIEGTWLVTVTPPPGGPPSYLSVASFARGGVLTTAPDPSIGPGVTSTGQGSWERTGPGQYISTHVGFIYGAGGSIVGTFRINGTYRLNDKNSFDGFGQLQICDPAGNNCFAPGPPGVPPGCATLHGERLRPTGTTCSF